MIYLKYYITKIDKSIKFDDMTYAEYEKIKDYEPGKMSLSQTEYEERQIQEKKLLGECTFSIQKVAMDSKTEKETIKEIEKNPLFIRWLY